MQLTACLGLHVWRRRVDGHGIRPSIGYRIGAGLLAMLYGLYNWSLTGNHGLPPRAILNPTDRYGFGTGIGRPPVGRCVVS